MITAIEARKSVEQGLNGQAEHQLKRVENAIETAIKNNSFSCTVSGKLLPSTTIKLMKELYKVEFVSDQRDGDYTNISW